MWRFLPACCDGFKVLPKVKAKLACADSSSCLPRQDSISLAFFRKLRRQTIVGGQRIVRGGLGLGLGHPLARLLVDLRRGLDALDGLGEFGVLRRQVVRVDHVGVQLGRLLRRLRTVESRGGARSTVQSHRTVVRLEGIEDENQPKRIKGRKGVGTSGAASNDAAATGSAVAPSVILVPPRLALFRRRCHRENDAFWQRLVGFEVFSE